MFFKRKKKDKYLQNITKKLNETLVVDSSDLAADYLELGIDSFFDESSNILRGMPFAKTFFWIGKVGLNIRDKYLIDKTKIFIYELNSGTIDRKKLSDYQEELNSNPKKLEKELGRVLILLDQFVDIEKSVILGKIFKAYVNQEIDWDLFCEYSEITNRLFISDFEILRIIFFKDYNKYNECDDDKFRIERIYSLGILGNVFPSVIETRHMHGKILNKLGKKYCELIFSNSNSNKRDR